MGIEIVVMAFAVASAFFGLLGPVVIWATWTSVANRRIVRELEAADDIDNVAIVDGADASAPARLSLSICSRATQLDAVVRGEMKLWHIRIARRQIGDPRAVARGRGANYALVDDSWTGVAKSARRMPAAETADSPLEHHVAGAFSLFCEKDAQSAAERELMRPYVVTLLETQARANNRLLQVVSTETDVFLEVTRGTLKSSEALPLLRRCARFVDALEGATATPRLLPPSPSSSTSKAGTTESGTPIGVPTPAIPQVS